MKTDSRHLQAAVDSFSALPGIGSKTALRLALHLLDTEVQARVRFAEAIESLEKVKSCEICHNISDESRCRICLDPARDHSTICVVENLQDIMAIEETGQYRGTYHRLGGVISPIEGVGPEDLTINSLLDRIEQMAGDAEIIMAISPTIDGETTMYYVAKLLEDRQVKISQIARGVSFGGELQYTDELTLARSISGRTPYNS